MRTTKIIHTPAIPRIAAYLHPASTILDTKEAVERHMTAIDILQQLVVAEYSRRFLPARPLLANAMGVQSAAAEDSPIETFRSGFEMPVGHGVTVFGIFLTGEQP